MNIGVPQGSVLGPILFLIYFNSLLTQKFRGKLVAFADDIAFIYSDSSNTQIANYINYDLTLLSNWFYNHCLILSDKTKLMHFRKASSNITDSNYICHFPECHQHSSSCSNKCVPIDFVESFKYLGLTLDSNLNWKHHCLNIKNHINMLVSRFYLLRTLIPADILNLVYFALVQSKLSYGLPFWGGTYENTLQPIAVRQNFVIKTMCFKKKSDSSWILYRNKKILPLKHLYVFRVLKMFFSKSGNRLTKVLKKYDLRDNNLCYIPKFNLTLLQKSFLVSAPKLFNKLPNTIKCNNNINSFLKVLKEFLFTNSDINILFK